LEIVIIFRWYKNFYFICKDCKFLSLDVQNYFKYHCKDDTYRIDNQRSKISRYVRTDSLKAVKFGVWNIYNFFDSYFH